jgi:CRP-like cAMP-binding protein/Fe-S-cluster-containing hydrogenase component 2
VEIPTQAAENAAAVIDVTAPPIPGAVPIPRDELGRLPFLEGLSAEELAAYAPSIWQRTFEEGETVLQTGEYGDAAFYILEGFAEVRVAGLASAPTPRRVEGMFGRVKKIFRPSPAAPPSQSGERASADTTIVLADMPVDLHPGYQARLQPGDLFGEVSALSRYSHSTDVVAAARLRCVVLPTPVLRRLKYDVEAFGDMVDRLYVERTLDVHLSRVELLSALPPQVRSLLRQRAELLSYQPNEEIVAQGTPADAFYLVRGGHVKVTVVDDGRELAVTYLRKGDYSGESALLLDQPWPFSLTALEHVELVRIGRDEFRRAVEASTAVEDELWQSVVARLRERGFAMRNPRAVESLRLAMDTGLIHGESVLLIDLETCTKCDDCVRACADTHDGTPRFIREGVRISHYSVPTACYHCTDPVCMIGCPTGAISRPLGTLQVVINQATCIGCHRCVNGCPWNNIVPVPFYSPTLRQQIELATKCDLCVGRDAGPACVQMCPHGSAIRVDFKDPDIVRTMFADV